MYDILISVYGNDFYSKHDVLKQCGPISDIADRMTDRFRCREKALISPIASMIPQTDCKLTMEQKYAVIGLLHQHTSLPTIRAELARMFPESFSPRSTIDLLSSTFGTYKDFCIDIKEEPIEGQPTKQTFILGEKFSCHSVFKALKEQKKLEEDKGKKKKKKPFMRYKAKGQVVGTSISKYRKGNLV